MSYKRILCLLLPLIFGCTPKSADISLSGEDHFKKQCMRCHGESGKGSHLVPFKLWEKKSVQGNNDFLRIVQKGKPQTMMRGFKDRISVEDIEKIRQYLLDQGDKLNGNSHKDSQN